jgi:hypothetical protein
MSAVGWYEMSRCIKFSCVDDAIAMDVSQATTLSTAISASQE